MEERRRRAGFLGLLQEDPLGEIFNIDKFFNILGGSRDEVVRGPEKPVISPWDPACEIFTEEGYCIVRVELPGLEKDEINISIQKDYLIIKGERTTPADVPEGRYELSQFYYGDFETKLKIAHSLDVKKIKAKLKNGILTVKIPFISEEEMEKRRAGIDITEE